MACIHIKLDTRGFVPNTVQRWLCVRNENQYEQFIGYHVAHHAERIVFNWVSKVWGIERT